MEKCVAFNQLPESARLWIFHTAREMNQAEHSQLSEKMKAFIEQWLSHGAPVVGSYEILYNRFLLIAVDQEKTEMSGCSIDQIHHLLTQIEQNSALTLFNSPPVCWRHDDEIHCADRDTFKEIIQGGSITQQTIVFNEMIQTVGEYRSGNFELPFTQSWHAKAFKNVV